MGAAVLIGPGAPSATHEVGETRASPRLVADYVPDMATAQDPLQPSSQASSRPSSGPVPPPPPPITPDDKNWTWVLERTCPDCGFDGASTPRSAVPGLVRANAADWVELMAHPHVRLRPAADQWSALEYACHVRDVFRLYTYRLDLMLTQDGPTFPNWDQDETAVLDRYDLRDPVVVLAELQDAAEAMAAAFESVADDQWERTGTRSDGARFTIDTFSRYFIHDPIHHVDDVRRGNRILADGELD